MAFMRRTFTPRLPARACVNFNALTEDGLVRVRASHLEGTPRLGELVRIYEPTDEIEGLARIKRINERTGLLYLDVRWDSLHDAEPVHVVEASGAGAADPGPVAHIDPAPRPSRPKVMFAV